MNIPWDDVQLFLAIAETGSLSAASRQLQLGQPTVSRRLALLEHQLGYQLFHREVGGAKLTSAGEKLVTPARRMAEWAGEISRAASSGDRSPSGTVRITAAPGVAYDFVAPFAGWLAQKYPKLRLEVLTSVQYLDLARGEADLAIRWRAPTSEDLTVIASLNHANAAVASKEYVAKLPKNYGFADVGWIAWSRPFDVLPPNPQLEALIPDFQPVFTSDNFLVQHRAAEEGLGATIRGMVRHRFSAPTNLVPLNLDLGPFARSDLFLVSAKSALDTARIRTVADLLAKELQRLQKS